MINKIFVTLLVFQFFFSKGNKPELNKQETIEIPASSIDYSLMNNWALHPSKASIFNSFFYRNLNISIIDKDLKESGVIEIPNNAKVNTGIDIFYVHPTSSVNRSSLNSEVRVIPIEEQDKAFGKNYITNLVIAQGGLLAKHGRIFAPRYRESTATAVLSNKVDDKLRAEIMATSYSDVKAAFLDYLNNYNHGNKIILAGHSQGSFLLGLLLRDLFDEDETLRSKLITATLGGMGHVFAKKGTYVGGWWKNIPLCQKTEECGCVQTWRSYSESFKIKGVNSNLYQFNKYLVNSGLVYRAFNADTDWFVQDKAYYGENYSPIKYYITNNNKDYRNFRFKSRFLAFSDMYEAKFQRDDDLTVGLRVKEVVSTDDQRRNELKIVRQTDLKYLYWGYHTKDYHIYNWGLMQQIDEKINNSK